MDFKKAKGFLLSPAKTFESEKGTVKSAFLYLLVMLVVFVLLQGVAQLVLGVEAGGVVLVAGVSYVTGLVGTLVTGVWLHLWAWLFGARGFGSTLKIVVYGSTPSFLLGWLVAVPEIGRYLRLVLIIWGFVLFWIGLKKLHHLPSWKAGTVAGIALVVGFVLFVGFAFFVLDFWIPLLLSFA